MFGAALDDPAGEDLRYLSDEKLEESFTAVRRRVEILRAEGMRRLAEIARRETFRREGHLSAASWLEDRFGLPSAEAWSEVRTAEALQEMPRVRAAFAAGELAHERVRLLASARDAYSEAFASSEETLLEAARSLTMRGLRRALVHWRAALDQQAMLRDARRLRDRRRLHVSRTFLGMVRIDGDLDPESGETVLTALAAMADAEVRDGPEERRTPSQQRADTLVEICRRFMDDPNRAEVAGERPHVTVLVDLEALERDGRGRAELERTGVIPQEQARKLACDASVSRVITRGASEPLDVGRRTPVVPAGMRRAVVVRDRGCRFPGCERPQAWCDAHHVVHWARGGPTSLANLVLLCRPHHRMVHEDGRFRVELSEGRPVFTGRLGPLEDRAPPLGHAG